MTAVRPETGTATVSARAAWPWWQRVDVTSASMALGVAVVGFVVLVVLNGNYTGLVVTTGIGYAVVTVGMVVQIGYSHQLAFSQSVFMGLGAYGGALLETRYNQGVLVSMVAVIIGSVVVAYLIGAVVTRAPGLALALATLLLPLFLYELITYSSYLGTFAGISGVLPLWSAGTYTEGMVRTGIVAVLILAVVVWLAMRIMRSGVGLQLMALAANERLAESMGVNLRRRRLGVFIFGSVLAALGGAIVASAQGIVTPDLVNESAEITLLIMVFVPGRRNVIAAIIGAVVVEWLSTSTQFISTNLPTFEGALLVIVLLVEPDGIVGLCQRGWEAVRRKHGERAIAADRATAAKEGSA
jgi:branched-chain amino acid transport system permease protein